MAMYVALGWFASGVLALGLMKITRVLMNHQRPFTEDIVLNEKGERVAVDLGYRAYLETILFGLFSFWTSCGSLAMALEEWAMDTNHPGMHTYSYWRGDCTKFSIFGPLALVASITTLPLIYKSR